MKLPLDSEISDQSLVARCAVRLSSWAYYHMSWQFKRLCFPSKIYRGFGLMNFLRRWSSQLLCEQEFWTIKCNLSTRPETDSPTFLPKWVLFHQSRFNFRDPLTTITISKLCVRRSPLSLNLPFWFSNKFGRFDFVPMTDFKSKNNKVL